MTNSDVVLLACGDILLADFYFNIGYGTGSFIEKFGEEKLFENIRPLIKKGDLIIGNLESPMAESSIHTGLHKQEFLSSPSTAAALNKEGFKVMSIANNHISQHGYEAFCETVQVLRHNYIDPVGEIYSERLTQNLVIKTIKEKRLGFLAFSLVDDKFYDSPWFYANNPDEADLLDQISMNKELCDYLILMLHWGDEFVDYPSVDQINLAHVLVDAGCDLILGSHSHIFQGIEQYKGKVIAYSLGNFIFSMPWKPTRASGILTVQFQENGQHGYSVQPIWINNNWVPTIPVGKQKDYVENRIAKVNSDLKSSVSCQQDYLNHIRKCLRQYQRATRISFLKNFCGMPFYVSFQLIKEFFTRKFRQ